MTASGSGRSPSCRLRCAPWSFLRLNRAGLSRMPHGSAVPASLASSRSVSSSTFPGSSRGVLGLRDRGARNEQDKEHGDEVAGSSGDRHRVPELVVAEPSRPRVGASARQHDGADRASAVVGRVPARRNWRPPDALRRSAVPGNTASEWSFRLEHPPRPAGHVRPIGRRPQRLRQRNSRSRQSGDRGAGPPRFGS